MWKIVFKLFSGSKQPTKALALECKIRLHNYIERLWEKGDYQKIEKIFDYADSL